MAAKAKDIPGCTYCDTPAEMFNGRPCSTPVMCMDHMMLTAAIYHLQKAGTEVTPKTMTEYLVNEVGIPTTEDAVAEQMSKMLKASDEA